MRANPFQAARELKRASNAAKLSKIFAKPFIGAMQGHSDYVCTIAKQCQDLSVLVSGGFDGEVLIWDVASRSVAHRVNAFEGRVRGLAMSLEKDLLIAAGDDHFVQLYQVGVVVFMLIKELEASAWETGNFFEAEVCE
jgi:WD repeat and SOF domain-containing protein 1